MLAACLFETKPEPGNVPDTGGEFPAITPDLSVGNQWMYRSLQFMEHEDGSKGDSAVYFIHYTAGGDTLIAGVRYRILAEEDLAFFNTDYGLVTSQSLFAVLADSQRIEIKALRGGDGYSGLFPFKTAAGQITQRHAVTQGSGFDTVHFRDEIISLQGPLKVGIGWTYRLPGGSSGIAAATKTFLGPDSIFVGDVKLTALKFQIQVKGLEYLRIYEWYANGIKIFSRTSSAISYQGRDSSRTEEEYLGPRAFNGADTLAVLKSAGIN